MKEGRFAMNPSNEPFQEDALDAQLDGLARTMDQLPDTSTSRAYRALSQLHAETLAREAKAVERVRQRLAPLMMAPVTAAKHAESASNVPASSALPTARTRYQSQRVRQRSRLRVLMSSVAALLAVGLLLGGFFTVLQRRPPLPSFTNYHWHVIPSPNTSNGVNVLTGITVRTSTDAWAWGFTGGDPITASPQVMPLVEHWDGHQWRIAATPRPPRGGEIEDIVALASDDAWAVGDQLADVPNSADNTLLFEHWDGHHWTFVQDARSLGGFIQDRNNAAKLAALSPNDIWAVGSGIVSGAHGNILQSGLIEHWNGRVWQIISHPDPLFDVHFSAVTALSPDDVWVGGTNGPSTLEVYEHWDGSQWRAVPGPSSYPPYSSSHSFTNTMILSAMSAVSSNDVWAAGTLITQTFGSHASISTKPLFEHWNGHTWSFVASPPLTGMISDIVVLAPNNVWAVGTIGKEVPILTPAQEGHSLIEHWDGQHWSLIPNPSPLPFTSLGGIARDPTSPGKVWVAGTMGPALDDSRLLTNTQTLIETTP